MLDSLLGRAVKRPYLTVLGVVLTFFSFLSFQGVFFNWWADAEVYIGIVQTMFHGGALYKDAIDTKNIGFFLSYYLMYYPYAMLFDTKEFFTIWHASFLTMLYFGIGALSYKTVSYLYDKKTSLFTTIVILMFMMGNGHILFINQPQVAVFYLLCFLLYFYKTYNRQSKIDYFVYGVLLAIAFATSHIYAPLVLIVPFLSIQKNGIKNIKNILIECSMAGVGFFTIIGMIVLYLYKNDALADWWYWAIIFPQTEYLKESYIGFLEWGFGSSNIIFKYIVLLLSLFGIGPNTALVSYSTYVHYFIQCFVMINVGVFIYKRYIKKQNLEISPIETSLLFFSILTLWSRLLMTRIYGSDSYNLYLIPFLLINIPILFRFFPTFKTKFIKSMCVCFILCLIYIPFRYVYKSGLQEKFINSFEKQLVLLNPNKTPIIIGAPWTASIYSTKWKQVFYSANNTKSPTRYDFREKIRELKPEIINLHSITYSRSEGRDVDFFEYVDQNYTKVSDYIYIYSDKLSTWVLPEEGY